MTKDVFTDCRKLCKLNQRFDILTSQCIGYNVIPARGSVSDLVGGPTLTDAVWGGMPLSKYMAMLVTISGIGPCAVDVQNEKVHQYLKGL